MHPSTSRLAAVIAVVVAAIVVSHTLWSVGIHQQPAPYCDQWVSIQDGRTHDERAYPLSDLFRQHNEHRIAVPRLFFWLEHVWFDQRGPFLLTMSALTQLLHVLLFVWLFRRAAPERPGLHATIMASGVFLTFEFAASQIQNLIEPFQLQFVLVYAAATAALGALAVAATSPRRVAWTIASMAAAMFSTLSMANGLATWPLLALMAFQLRMPLRYAVGIAVVGAITILGYFHDYSNPTGHSSPLASLSDKPVEVASYAIAYLGSVIRNPDYSPHYLGGTLVLALGAIAAAGCSSGLVRFRVASSAAHRLALLYVVAFNVATAAMTALGRVNLPLEQATSMRYATPVLVMWSALFALYHSTRAAWPRRSGMAAIACVLVSLLLHQSRAVELDAYVRDQARYYSLGLRAGVQDIEAMEKSGDAKYIWAELAGYMIGRRLAGFGDADTTIIGRPFASVAPIPCATGRGAIDILEPVPESGWAFRADGWSALPDSGEPPTEVWFVDSDGTVCGCAVFYQDRNDVARVFPDVARRRIGWHGVGTVSDPEGLVQVFTRDAQGNCYRGPTRKLGRTRLAFETGTAADILDFHTSGQFELAPTPGPAGQSHPQVWSSMRKGIGEIEARVRAGEGALILPLNTGAVPFGTVVELLTEEGNVLDRVFPPATFGKWRRLRFDVPAAQAGNIVRLRARDCGTWSNQQFQVAPPNWLPSSEVVILDAASHK